MFWDVFLAVLSMFYDLCMYFLAGLSRVYSMCENQFQTDVDCEW